MPEQAFCGRLLAANLMLPTTPLMLFWTEVYMDPVDLWV